MYGVSTMSGEFDDCGEHFIDCICEEKQQSLPKELTTFESWWTQDLMVTAAHRYCLGRKTYIVSECVDWLLYNWNMFNKHTKNLIVKETQEAIERNRAGDPCDVECWQQIARLPLEKI